MPKHQLFQVGQNAIIRNNNGAILILRHKRSDKWLLPGGRINKGENWLKGLKREIKEETGMNFTIGGILDVDSFSDPKGFHYLVTFICHTDDKDVNLGNEHNEYVWINNADELKKYNFWHKDIVKRIKRAFDYQINFRI